MINIKIPTIGGVIPIEWTLAPKNALVSSRGFYVAICILQRLEYDSLREYLYRARKNKAIDSTVLFTTDDGRGYIASEVFRIKDVSRAIDLTYPAALRIEGMVGHFDSNYYPMIELICSRFQETIKHRSPGGISWRV